MLLCAADGTIIDFDLVAANTGERDAALALLEANPIEGATIICDKGFAGADFETAVRLAREACAIADETEYHEIRMNSADALVDVLYAAGRADEAADALRRALELHEQKGDVYGAERLRQSFGPPAT